MARASSFSRAGVGTLLLGVLAGCTVGPNYRPPAAASIGVPAQFSGPVETQVSEADLAHWWTLFDDPVLDWLVTRALATNIDIDAAGARLRQARAVTRESRSALFPTLDASGSANHTWQRNGNSGFVTSTGADGGTIISSGGGRGSASTTSLNAGLDAAYEVDLFGGIRRSIEASRGDEQSTEFTLRDTQRSVLAEVALDYVDARVAQARLKIARDNLAAQDETLQIVGWRVQAGLANSLDLEQARQLRAQTAASIPALETNYATEANALSVLIGEAPGAVNAALDASRAIPIASTALAADVPANVLARRPDVRAAERSLAAETARIGVQEAQLYPALRLSGSLSGTAGSIGNIAQNAIGSVIGAISAPIFEGGAIRARIEGQRSTTRAAYDTYRSTVLIALQDVENALVTLSSANRREVDFAVAAEAAANANQLARLQYQSGLVDFETLLDAQRTLLSSQDQLATARADRATGLIQLYKALGGGWQDAPLPASAARGAAIASATPVATTRN